jgi:hypothetical protein
MSFLPEWLDDFCEALSRVHWTFYVQLRYEYCGGSVGAGCLILYTMFIVKACQMPTELLSTRCRAETFFSASGTALLQEVADGKINVQ